VRFRFSQNVNNVGSNQHCLQRATPPVSSHGHAIGLRVETTYAEPYGVAAAAADDDDADADSSRRQQVAVACVALARFARDVQSASIS
jgi:hypothetical protein